MQKRIINSKTVNETAKEKGTFIEWIRVHKTELIITGISIASLVGIIVVINNTEVLQKTWDSLRNLIKKESVSEAIPQAFEAITENTTPINDAMSATNLAHISLPREYTETFYVTNHIRNLHPGWKASPEKLATAAANGYELLPGQTWVVSYAKGVKAA